MSEHSEQTAPSATTGRHARRFFYDTEFHEQGPTSPIDLISIGIVAETGEEFYRVHMQANWRAAWSNEWLREHVLPSLPGTYIGGGWQPFTNNPAVVTRDQLRRDLLDFLKPSKNDPVELWAWYADYDHVVLSQIFGRMIDLPPGMPMFTHDLKQAVDHLDLRAGGVFNEAMRDVPLTGDEHNALADARQVRDRFATAVARGAVL